MKKYWSRKAAALTPYVAGEQPQQKLIKLNTNENAYPPSPRAVAAAAAALGRLRLYPDPDSADLRAAIAQLHGVEPENIFCSNGSDEALAFSFMAFFDPGVPVRTYDITYSFYPVWARIFDLTLEEIPLKIDFGADVEAMTGASNIVIANPNAPTGIAEDADDIVRMARSTKGVAVVDEAYGDFGCESMAGQAAHLDNLVVVRTLSKSHSLAGMRVGYAVANKNLVAALGAVKDSFNSYPLDAVAQAVAAAAIRDRGYYDDVANKIKETRTRTTDALQKMGLPVLPSSANFIFVRFGDAQAVFRELRERGILVRYFAGGRTGEYLRVTIGTDAEMDAFLTAVSEIVR